MDRRILFEPGKIGDCLVKNRIVMAPMGNINMSDPLGRPGKKMIDYFTERARGGAGLIITGLIPVSYGIDPTVSEDNDTSIFPRIDGSSRTRMSGWRDLVAGVRAFDTRFFIQLTAGLGRVGSPEAMLKGKIMKSASLNKNFYIPQVPHLGLSDRAVKKIIKGFGQSALNAKVCGFDGIHLHGHEGYMMDQLTSKPWNRRKLGRYRDLHRFALDVVAEIKAQCGRDYPIIYRIDLTQGLKESYGEDIFKKHFKGMERSFAEGLAFCRELALNGVDAFDVDKGCYDNWFFPHPPAYFDDIPYVYAMAGRLKEYFAANNIAVPVIAVGKMGKPEQAEAVLKNNWADYVMLGRPLLADPYWPQKVRQGREKEIIHCIGDQEACIQSFIMGGHPCCTVNPYAGFEDSKKLTRTATAKKVAVIGAGPAGCEAARTAWQRGHDITLYEKGSRIGGQILLGSQWKIKHDLALYLENLQYQMEMLASQGLEIHLNREAGLEELKGQYDVIICCTGLTGQIPAIEGLNHMPHREVRKFLQEGGILPAGVKQVAVVGGGLVGCELAYSLAAEQKADVTVIEKLPHLMNGVVHANRAMMLWMMMGRGAPSGSSRDALKKPIRAFNLTRVQRFEPGRAILASNRKRPDPYTPWFTLIPENVHNPFARSMNEATEEISIDSDFVIFATGGRGMNQLYTELAAANAAPEIYCAGDCQQPASIWEAITNANEIARFI
jgi:2-enoate reductase